MSDASKDDGNRIAMEVTVLWWERWLEAEDQMPNEPVIQHRALVWERVYELEYVMDVQWWGITRTLSRSRWLALRDTALQNLSMEYFGPSPDDPSKPAARLSLVARPKHSNFGSCDECTKAKVKWLKYRKAGIAERQSMGTIEEVKAEIFAHMMEVKQERKKSQQMHQDACARSGYVFQYDDKCGSDYVHLPAYAREPGEHTNRYRYKFGLQGNLVPGTLMRFSYVPPCLRLGANFGCSCLFSTILRLKELGKLGHTFIRMSDGGPDNNSATSHAFHWLLVHVGVVQKVEWIRLRPKHSHNFADRCNSMIKEVIQPKRGVEGDCLSPWDMQSVINKAMAKQNSKIELAWHWVNFDWTQWLAPFISNEFGGYSDFRHWVYQVRRKRSLLPSDFIGAHIKHMNLCP